MPPNRTPWRGQPYVCGFHLTSINTAAAVAPSISAQPWGIAPFPGRPFEVPWVGWGVLVMVSFVNSAPIFLVTICLKVLTPTPVTPAAAALRAAGWGSVVTGPGERQPRRVVHAHPPPRRLAGRGWLWQAEVYRPGLWNRPVLPL